MIEFNLLPDVKLTYIKTKRTKRLVTTVAIIVGGVSLIMFIFLFTYVNVIQKARINSLSKQISSTQAELKGDANLNKILTIQKQLQTLPNIESQLPVTSRMFGYLSAVVPSSVTISNIQIDFTKGTAIITGNAKDLTTVNQFVDTLKFSTFSDAQSKNNQAFTNVVLTSFSFSNSSNASQSAYTISFSFDPKLFIPTEDAQLTVPSTTTTRSIVNQPSDLFKANSGGN